MRGGEGDKYRVFARDLLREKPGQIRELEQNGIRSRGKEGY